MVRAEMLWAHDDLVQVALEQLGDHVSVLGGSLRNLSIMIARIMLNRVARVGTRD